MIKRGYKADETLLMWNQVMNLHRDMCLGMKVNNAQLRGLADLAAGLMQLHTDLKNIRVHTTEGEDSPLPSPLIKGESHGKQ